MIVLDDLMEKTTIDVAMMFQMVYLLLFLTIHMIVEYAYAYIFLH